MFSAFAKAIRQLDDRNIRKPLWISVALALGVFVVLWTVTGGLIKFTALFETGWLETISDGLGWTLVLVLTWVLFPGVVSAVVALFLDQVASAVEDRHYPHLSEPKGQTMGEQVVTAVRFLGVMVLLNLLILPFMLLGPAYPLLFYCVNGYLLGREYFELVAARRLDLKGTVELRRDHSGRIFMAGVGTALMLTVPIVNLLTPVIATAAMVHLFESIRRGRGGDAGGGKAESAGHAVSRPAANSVLDGGEPKA